MLHDDSEVAGYPDYDPRLFAEDEDEQQADSSDDEALPQADDLIEVQEPLSDEEMPDAEDIGDIVDAGPRPPRWVGP